MRLNGTILPVLSGMAITLVALALAGCASKDHKTTEAQRHFSAGQEETFAMLQRSGIEVIRVTGPFQRPVVLWRQEMTLAQVILEAGYLEPGDPNQIIIQRGPTTLPIDPAILLRGEDVPVEPRDVIHVVP